AAPTLAASASSPITRAARRRSMGRSARPATPGSGAPASASDASRSSIGSEYGRGAHGALGAAIAFGSRRRYLRPMRLARWLLVAALLGGCDDGEAPVEGAASAVAPVAPVEPGEPGEPR